MNNTQQAKATPGNVVIMASKQLEVCEPSVARSEQKATRAEQWAQSEYSRAPFFEKHSKRASSLTNFEPKMQSTTHIYINEF